MNDHYEINTARLDFDDSRWKTFVQSFPNANAFHSPEMNKAFCRSKGFSTFPIFALNKDTIVACAFPVLLETVIPFLGKYGRRIVLYSSPLALDSEVGVLGLKILIKEIEAIAKNQALFAEIRNSRSYGRRSSEVFESWEYLPRENYLVDLSLGENELKTRFSSGTRKNTRRAKLHGCSIQKITTTEDFSVAIELIQNLYQRKKIPMINVSIFNTLFNLYNTSIFQAIFVKKGIKTIGVRFTLSYADTVYDWYAAADLTYSKDYPNEALVWETIHWGCTNGYSTFDFGGGGVPGKYYGPAVFKEKFKGVKVEHGRYRWTSNRILLNCFEKIYKWRQNA